MKILVLNTGSSSLKFDLVDVAANRSSKLAHGSIQNVTSYREAVFEAVRRVRSELGGADNSMIDAVGHRVVHGGGKFYSPTLIDNRVMAELEKLNELAPLHNPIALEAIVAAKEILGESIPMVAVFDTAFHHSIPAHAATYALPHELTERHHIRRYGFHGIAHEYMMRRFGELKQKPIHEPKLITIQLGSGCSITAIRNGKSVDTSMGFTPLEGLVMATRSGDIDAGLIGFLARKENLSITEIESLLNTRSGLLGVSGFSPDMREVFAVHKSNARAALAIEMFCYHIKKYLGAYLAMLNGADAILFGGGIGENNPEIRATVCEGMDWFGLKIDSQRNAEARGREAKITADDSAIEGWVIPVDEATLIARAVIETLATNPNL